MSLLSAIYNKSNNTIRAIMLNSYAISLHVERYGKKFDDVFNQFSNNEKMSLNELREYQLHRFKIMINHAYNNVPYYNQLMNALKLRPSDFKKLEDISLLPLLTREDVKKSYNKLKAVGIPKYKIRHGHTSGTTGSPLQFLWDTDVCVAHHAADWRQKKWAGANFGDPFISIQGRQVVPIDIVKPPFWVKNHIHNQLFMSSFHLKNEYIGSYVDKILEFNPKAVEGYPSSLYILASYMKHHDIYCPVPAVLTSSETLHPIQRELIEERFKCRIFDFYGMAERVIYASECQIHAGKHLNMDYGITEIVDNNGEALTNEKFGTIVATGLWNFAMPLIRYKTSDISAISSVECECGRSFPLVDNVTTKLEDIIFLEDGKMIPPSILTHPFKPLDNIVKSQIVQHDFWTVEIKIVKNSDYNDNDAKTLLAGMTERLGTNVKINIKYVDEIPNDKSGKFRWVISKVAKNLFNTSSK